MAVGVVCEFNPFHNGHRYLLSEIKRLTGENVVCVMSGNFVQRGEIAAYDKTLRADFAVRNGADIVLENPFPFCCATAERFAASAVHILSASGLCDTLSFGCEIGTEALYRETAAFLADRKTEKMLSGLVHERKNESFVRLREQAVRTHLGERHAALLQNPNSLLGLEYALAVTRQNVPLSLLPIPRIGAAHDEKGFPDGNIASASYLRLHGDSETLKRFCPESAAEIFSDPRRLSEEKVYAALRAKLLFSPSDAVFDVPTDYREKMINSAKKYARGKDFFESLRAKHITESRLRHMIYFTLFSVTPDELAVLPDAAVLLAASDDGKKMLKKYRNEHGFMLLPTLSHSKNARPFDRARLAKQTLAEKMCETLIDGTETDVSVT